MRKLFAVSILLFFLSCSGNKGVPAGILKPEKMQLIFWDYIRADAFAKDFIKKDKLKNDTLENLKLQKKIFDYYKIDREDFYRSYEYYTDHPELMNGIMDSMIATQNKRRLQHRLKKQ